MKSRDLATGCGTKNSQNRENLLWPRKIMAQSIRQVTYSSISFFEDRALLGCRTCDRKGVDETSVDQRQQVNIIRSKQHSIRESGKRHNSMKALMQQINRITGCITPSSRATQSTDRSRQ